MFGPNIKDNGVYKIDSINSILIVTYRNHANSLGVIAKIEGTIWSLCDLIL